MCLLLTYSDEPFVPCCVHEISPFPAKFPFFVLSLRLLHVSIVVYVFHFLAFFPLTIFIQSYHNYIYSFLTNFSTTFSLSLFITYLVCFTSPFLRSYIPMSVGMGQPLGYPLTTHTQNTTKELTDKVVSLTQCYNFNFVHNYLSYLNLLCY